jgi:hypothetical protein
MLRPHWRGTSEHPRILGIGAANALVRLTQEESLDAADYQGERIRMIFLNSDIDHRHFPLEGTLNLGESSDQLNQRYLRCAYPIIVEARKGLALSRHPL